MIGRVARRALRPFRPGLAARQHTRGVRPDVPLPFDMFDEVRTAADQEVAHKLEGIYHKGHERSWSGPDTFDALVARHGGITLPTEQRDAVRGVFAVILWGELAAWKVSAALAARLEPLEAKMAATSQAHDEARHFYVMHRYLSAIGEVPSALGPRTTRVLAGTLRANSLAKKLVGMQLLIEPLALALFQLVRESHVEPVLCDLLVGIERDEARHVALGVLHLPRLLRSMTAAEAADLYTWEFLEHWHQVAMMHELAPHFAGLGLDVRDVMEIGRAKQIRANRLLQEELGTPMPVFEAFVRFFDAKAAWEFPPVPPAGFADRVRGAVAATRRGA